MKKILIIAAGFICAFLWGINAVFAYTPETYMVNDITMQNHISDIGYRILNANKIDVRMIFAYKNKNDKIKLEPGLTKRQIMIYDKFIQFAADDNEVAALISREICKTAESYTGMWRGLISSAQIKLAPKKYQILFDKRAVDLMVKADYNPIALITFLNKAYPQKRYDNFARTNLTTKRLANIYEYIYTKYPYYLKNNEYIENEAYQNFLLTSVENRKKLYDKVKSGSKKTVDYE